MERKIEEAFLTFAREVYIPGVVGQGVLSKPRLMRINHSEEDGDSVSIALHLEAESHEVLQQYLSGDGHVYPTLLIRHFGEQVMGFTTLMEYIGLE